MLKAETLGKDKLGASGHNREMSPGSLCPCSLQSLNRALQCRSRNSPKQQLKLNRGSHFSGKLKGGKCFLGSKASFDVCLLTT